MDAPVPQAGPLADSRDGPAENLGVERCADGGGEDQVGLVPPDLSRRRLCVLAGLVGPQEVDEGLGEMQGTTAASGLEIGQENALPAVAQQLPSDPDERHWAIQLQIVPGDPEQLTSSETESEGHDVGGLEAVALHLAQEGLCLLGSQRSAFTPWNLHPVGDRSHVARQESLLFGPA